jgi:putative ABC transport system permease protein
VEFVSESAKRFATTDASPDFVVEIRRIDRGDELAPVLDQQRVTATAVTVVALTVGGLGILGVGLASVRERGRDFGLRRALGASKTLVFAGVIVQTLLEVLLAAIVAIPLSAVAVELFARRLVLASLPLPSSTSLPLSSALLGLSGALIVGLVAGLLPAFRAARASVVQALRD